MFVQIVENRVNVNKEKRVYIVFNYKPKNLNCNGALSFFTTRRILVEHHLFIDNFVGEDLKHEIKCVKARSSGKTAEEA